jgi:hypothetical protein
MYLKISFIDIIELHYTQSNGGQLLHHFDDSCVVLLSA